MSTDIDTRCTTCIDHPGWGTDGVCPDCLGSGVQGAAREPRADILGAIMAVESGDASPLETLETFGLLIRTGIINSLQGSWQRAVADAVEGDLIDPTTGNLTDTAIAALGDLDETEEF
jgi:hypothetical protein